MPTRAERLPDTSTADLCLGGTKSTKVVHRSTCRHARMPYPWARGFPTMKALIDMVWAKGAQSWHSWCSFCLPEFVDYERRTYLADG